MSNRQSTILNLLRSGPITGYSIADYLGAPDASVRRDIQSLRKAGYVINDPRDNNGTYRLVSA